jgi:hypothetical protein
MSTRNIVDFSIYRWRYILGYIVLALLFIGLLAFAGLVVPGGITTREMSAVATSDLLSIKSFSPEMIINIPYYLLQKVSIMLLGVSVLSIKLPSIILAFFAALGVILLLRTWFRRNIAILTGLIAFTAGPFLLAVQSGTPDILYILWPSWILLAASKLSRSDRLRLPWLIVLTIAITLSLYTPLALYVLLALVSASIIHPHLRHVIRHIPRNQVLIALGVGVLLVTPLLYSIAKDPHLIFQLIGIPEMINVRENLAQLAMQYGSFFNPANDTIMTPVYSLPVVIMMIVGLYQIFSTKYTASSYVITAWLVMVAAVAVINPRLVNITFIPTLILIGYGLSFIIRYWYRLFPRNPYARVAGLIPLVILITSLTLSGFDRFTYGYLYNPSSAHVFSKDIVLLRKELRQYEPKSVILHVAKGEEAFYRAVANRDRHDAIDQVTTANIASSTTKVIIATHDTKDVTRQLPTRILTSANSQEGDRFYIYKKAEK